VSAAKTLTNIKALQAMLIPSATNIAILCTVGVGSLSSYLSMPMLCEASWHTAPLCVASGFFRLVITPQI